MDLGLVERAVGVIADAIQEHDPIKVYALVSGGNDSTVMAHLAAKFGPRLDALAHINTGIGVEETREYTRAFARWLDVSLIEKHSPVSYEDLVMEYGFPGPAAHAWMYRLLKERALRELRREAQNGKRRRVLFITGVRKSESKRRMGHVQSVQREGNTVWVAPIKDFTHKDIWAYRDAYELPRNEVSEVLHMSGECLCGAFSSPGELDWISKFYPDVANQIKALEQRAHKAGVKSCHWGPQDSSKIKGAVGMLCSGCEYSEQDVGAGAQGLEIKVLA